MPDSLPAPCQFLLGHQEGVLARWQADEAGISPTAIDTQLRSGRWQPLYRGVYAAFSGPPPRSAVLWAAVLRASPGAVLSHHTAAALDGLADPCGALIHVTVDSERRVAISPSEGAWRISVHYSSRLDRTRHPAKLPPRTKVEETTLDLADCADNLADAVSWLICACSRRLTTPDRLLTAMRARPVMRWRRELSSALSDVGDGVHSALERRYVRRVERPHRLPRPERQARTTAGDANRYFDNYYKEFGVAVELDGQASHPNEARWRDIRRDNASAVLGIMTLRYSWSDVTRSPCRTAAEIAQVLIVRGWKGQPHPCQPNCPVGFS